MANTGLTTKNGKLYLNGEEYAGGGTAELLPARLLLPSVIDVVVGKQCDFWLEDYIKNPSRLPVRFDFSALANNEFNTFDGGHVRLYATPAFGTISTGDVNVSLKAYKADDSAKIHNGNAGNLVNSQTLTIRKVSNSGSGTYNVLIVGDSLVEGTGTTLGYNPAETYKLLAADNNVTINQIGTKTATIDGVTYRHEGYGSRSWQWFTDNNDSPFVKNGVFSFATYMEDNFPTLDGIDFCVVMLGTNHFTDTTTLATYSQKFINKLVSEYPDCKVAVGIPALGAKYTDITTSQEDRLRAVAETYLDLYDNGENEDYENVTCIGQGCWIDREHDYSFSAAKSTPYSPENNVSIHGDTIHPLVQGYKQWGRAVYCKIRSWIAGNL